MLTQIVIDYGGQLQGHFISEFNFAELYSGLQCWVFSSAHHLSDPNTDSETKSEKSEKVYQNPHTQAKLLPLGPA